MKRRRFLQRTVGGVGAVGLAGCSSVLGPADGADDPGYAQWLYEPDPAAYFPDVEDGEVSLGFAYTEPEHVIERKGAFVGSGMSERQFQSNYVAANGMYGVTGSDVVRRIQLWGSTTDTSRNRTLFVEGMAANFDGEAVRTNVSEGEPSHETYEGWDVYDAGNTVTAVSDRHVFRAYVLSGAPEDPDRPLARTVEEVVDVVDGRRERYESDDVRAFTDALGDGPHAIGNVFGQPRDRPLPDSLAVGKVGLDAGDRRMRFGALFPESELGSPDAARKQWEDAFERLESVERDGRAVVATGTAEPATWLE